MLFSRYLQSEVPPDSSQYSRHTSRTNWDIIKSFGKLLLPFLWYRFELCFLVTKSTNYYHRLFVSPSMLSLTLEKASSSMTKGSLRCGWILSLRCQYLFWVGLNKFYRRFPCLQKPDFNSIGNSFYYSPTRQAHKFSLLLLCRIKYFRELSS